MNAIESMGSISLNRYSNSVPLACSFSVIVDSKTGGSEFALQFIFCKTMDEASPLYTVAKFQSFLRSA